MTAVSMDTLNGRTQPVRKNFITFCAAHLALSGDLVKGRTAQGTHLFFGKRRRALFKQTAEEVEIIIKNTAHRHSVGTFRAQGHLLGYTVDGLFIQYGRISFFTFFTQHHISFLSWFIFDQFSLSYFISDMRICRNMSARTIFLYCAGT